MATIKKTTRAKNATSAKKSVSKKTAASGVKKKTATVSSAKKNVTKKAAAKKTVKKTAIATAPVKKATPVKKTSAKPAPVKKAAPVKKTSAKPAPVKKAAPVKKTSAKPAPVKKAAPIKKTSAKPAPVKKATPIKKTSAKPAPAADAVTLPKEVYVDPVDYVRELPERYNDTRLAVMVKDPQWCYAYWDISDDDAAKHDLARRPLHLKIYRLLSPDNLEHKFQHLDINVASRSGSWYLMVGMPNNHFIAEIGYFDDYGNFILLARSNAFYAPRDTFSDIFDEEWLMPDELAMQLYGAFDPRMMASSASVLNVFRAAMFNLNSSPSSPFGGASSTEALKK